MILSKLLAVIAIRKLVRDNTPTGGHNQLQLIKVTMVV